MMRSLFLVAAISVIWACGQPPAPAAAQGGGSVATVESEAEFVARCGREIAADDPRASGRAPTVCAYNWTMVAAAGPMAEAILAAVPAEGETVQPQAMRTRVTQVRWAARPQGSLLAQGSLGPLDVQVERVSIGFYWGETGAMIPYDVIEALKGRGAEVASIACMNFGMGETNRAYRVAAPGRAPFALSIYSRTAPTANASSFYNVGVDITGQLPTLASLRRSGDEWAASCP